MTARPKYTVPIVLIVLILLVIGGITAFVLQKPQHNPGDVTATDMGTDWPFRVGHGTLHCQDNAVTFTDPSGVTYAVNGVADSMAALNGWQDLNAIWAGDGNGVKDSIGPIVQRGLALCA